MTATKPRPREAPPAPGTVLARAPVEVTATVNYHGARDDEQAAVTWGDGSLPEASTLDQANPAVFSHEYQRWGTFTLTVRTEHPEPAWPGFPDQDVAEWHAGYLVQLLPGQTFLYRLLWPVPPRQPVWGDPRYIWGDASITWGGHEVVPPLQDTNPRAVGLSWEGRGDGVTSEALLTK